ncbi:MAG: long-chain fatty acid--CoA ligase [Acidimicrobiia bacterium]|nr:long-chain fatty acid--CoA ligase [Acidimicrobiia bacterium]
MAERSEGSLTAVEIGGAAAAEAMVTEWDAGRAVLPLDPRAPSPERRRILAALRPTHVLGEWGPRALPGGVPVAPEVAAVLATSGTSGDPKGVELTREGLEASARAVAEALGSGRWLCCLPLHGVGGLGVVARAWSTGDPVDVIGRFDPAAVAESQAELVSLVPTTLGRCLDFGVDLARFSRVLVGGGPLDARLRARAIDAGATVVTSYGLTETWGGVVHDGRPLTGVEVRVGEDHEIGVRAPMVMRGYRLRADQTAAVLSDDGWLRTGDAGTWEDGTLRVVDRLRDIIVSGGVNVSPTEVEDILAEHPGVVDVGVAGATDSEWGERVVAHVVPADPTQPPTLSDLRSFAAERLSAAKLPRQLVVVDEVPRTPGGKPVRRLLGDVQEAR